MEKLLPAQEAEMPKDFMPLEQVGLQPLEATVSFIGMVYDFLPPSITRGTDYQCGFSLQDLSSSRDLKVKFFKPFNQLPKIQGLGDIIIVRKAKVKIWDGEKIALSSRSTSWTLFPLQEPPASSTWNKAHMFSISLPNTRVLPPEITYAQHLRRTLFNNFPIRPATSDTAMADSTAGSSALPPSAPRQKFCLIKDIEPEKYSDILGQVVKKYQPSNERIDLCVTDYTVNRLLYNHEWEGPSGGRDGDEYAYSNKSSSKWPGPHGKRVLLVTLWYPHLQFAADHVVIGDFVLLRNVHICLNSNGMLEGKLHQDKRYLEKILISKIRDKTDKRIIGVLQRRREYRDSLSKAQKEFLKLLESDEVFKAAAKSGAKPNGKARKKSRKQEESEQKEKLNFKSPEKNLSKYSMPPLQQRTPDQRNTPQKKDEILTPHPSLPFQNLNYRAAVRVIDFFPPTLAEFSVRSAHQALSDYSDSEAESIASPPETLTQNPRFAGDKWEWRFYLLVEDASGPAPRARMRLLVAGPDAEYLLKIDAEDLRLDAKALRKLEEKMFFVWGELFEARQASGDKGGSGGEVKNTPFECCIKEYGVKTENVAGEDVWERRFRMFGTTIM